MFKRLLNTNFKKCLFYFILMFIFLMDFMFQVGIYSVTSNIVSALIGAIFILLTFICCMLFAKYFGKTFQLKKNAKKELTK